MATAVQLRVNDKTWTITSPPETPLLYVVTDELALQGTALWLWTWSVRVLLGPRRWRRNPVVHHADIEGRRQSR